MVGKEKKKEKRGELVQLGLAVKKINCSNLERGGGTGGGLWSL